MSSQHQDSDHAFGIVIFDYDNEYHIDKTIVFLNKINYDKNKYKIILSTKHNAKAGELFTYVEEFKKRQILCEFIITLDPSANIETEAYAKCLGATFLVKIISGDTIDPELLNQVNNEANNNKHLVAFEKNNVKIIQYAVANDRYLNYNSFDKLFETLKIKEAYKDLNEK